MKIFPYLSAAIILGFFIIPFHLFSQNCVEAKDISDFESLHDAEVIWSDAFSDESTWVTSDSSTEPYGWIITDDPKDMPSTLDGPLTFESTTSDSGHALINSLDSPWQGDGVGRVAGGITNANPIDLREEDNVILRFESFYLFFNETRTVRVSPDNGESWTSYNITQNECAHACYQYCPNPRVHAIDISDVAGGESEVLIQFYFDDHYLHGTFWAVDDVELLSIPDNYLVVQDAVNPLLNYATPRNQLTGDTFHFSCTILNAGGLDRHGVEVTVSVINSFSQELLYQDNQTIDLLGRANDSIIVFDQWYHTEFFSWEDFHVKYEVEVPGEEEYNEYGRQLIVPFNLKFSEYWHSNGMFSKNDPYITEFTEGIANEDDEWYWGNLYYISPYTVCTLRAIETSLIPLEGTDGGPVVMSILEYQPEGPSMLYDELNINRTSNPNTHPEFKPIAYTFIQPEMIRDNPGKPIKIFYDQLLDPETLEPINFAHVELNPGKLYAVGLHVKGDEYKIPYTEGFSYKSGVGLLYAKNEDGQMEYSPGYENVNGPIVRMHVYDEVISSTESDIRVVEPLHVYPNPTNDILNLEFEMGAPGELEIIVFDVAGKVVIHEKVTGEEINYIKQDVSSLAPGSYHIQVSTKQSIRTSHFVIAR